MFISRTNTIISKMTEGEAIKNNVKPFIIFNLIFNQMNHRLLIVLLPITVYKEV